MGRALETHSVYHCLPELSPSIKTLIITGGLDNITPAFHSCEMADAIPGARLHWFPFGTHFCNLEYPKELANLLHQSFFVMEREGEVKKPVTVPRKIKEEEEKGKEEEGYREDKNDEQKKISMVGGGQQHGRDITSRWAWVFKP